MLDYYGTSSTIAIFLVGSGKNLVCRNHAGSGKARSAQVLRKWNSSGKASSDAGPELAGRESRVAMESPQALMCPLEKGVRGIKISVLCRCPAMNWSARS